MFPPEILEQAHKQRNRERNFKILIKPPPRGKYLIFIILDFLHYVGIGDGNNQNDR